ncbi:MAG: MFS transporter [Rhodobacteraceae bacterium]|nr:MFS transporter [Paracoccaceae bacterium]
MDNSTGNVNAGSTDRVAREDDYPNETYAWYVVGVLVLAYTVSYIDRTILTLMVGPIRATLGISDVQISLLHGLAFAIFYTVLGLPLGWLVDRANRTKIIAAGIFVWSVMTAVCGIARNFGQMFLARVGVGIGEAALSPAAYSMINDYFRPRRRTLAISIYATGVYIGSGLALVVGGGVIAVTPALDLPMAGHLEPWQVVFLAVGLPGLLVAALMLTVREPNRRGLMKVKSSKAGRYPTIGDTVAYILNHRATYGFHFAGFSMLTMLWSGCAAWIPAFFTRTYGWTPIQVGPAFGIVVAIFGTVGLTLGGLLAERLKARGYADGNMRTGIASGAALLPLGIAAPLMPAPELALTVYAGFVFFSSLPFGAAAAALQEITPNQMRGQVSALYLFVVNLTGIGIGPTIVASITQYGFGEDSALRYALAITAGITGPLAALLLASGLAAYRRSVAEARSWSDRAERPR